MAHETRTDGAREKLANRLVVGAMIVLGLLVVSMMVAAYRIDIAAKTPPGTALKETGTFLVSALLPVIGTWVGAIIAFYFSKDNLDAAAKATESALRSNAEMVRSFAPRMTTTRVTDAMIKKADIVGVATAPGDDVGKLKVADVQQFFKTQKLLNGSPALRMIITDKHDACIAIVHSALLAEMENSMQKKGAGAAVQGTDPFELLIKEKCVSDPNITYREFIEKSIAHVGEDRMMAEAKAAMEQIPRCQDVIVTKTGKKSEPLVGWITNVEISRLSQA